MSDQLDVLLRGSRPSPPAPSIEAVRLARAAALGTVTRFRARRRARIAVVGLAAALGALLVSPIGIGGRLAKLLDGTPAPPPVRTYFADSNVTLRKMLDYAAAAGHDLQNQYSAVIPEQARGVIAIEALGGPIYLWAAPTEDGRQCWLIQAGADLSSGRPHGLGSCEGSDHPAGIVPDTFWTDERPDVNIVHVRVYDESVATVDVKVENGHDLSLPVASGHALGTIPKPARVDGLVARNADGDVVDSWSR
jgi:hypothetical protein